MMSIGQTFAISMRRINKKWNKYALAMLVFLIPSIIVTALQITTQLIIETKTGCDLSTFVMYFWGLLSEEEIIKLQIDQNIMQRTLLLISPLCCAVSIVSLFSMFFTLPMSAYFLNVVRERDMTLGEAMKFAWKSVPLTLLMILKLIPWFLLFFVPGIIKTIQYSQAFYIKYDHPEWSSLECIKHSCKVTNGRKGRYFLYMLMLSALSSVGQSVINVAVNLLVNLVMFVLSIFLQNSVILVISNSLALAIIMGSISGCASIIFAAYLGVFKQALYAVYYEDARRSYLDDVEKDLRHTHESGFADVAHGDPFADNGSDSTVTYVGEATEVKKNDGGYADNNHGDPFGN